jgi:hypothetical protein
LETVLEHVRLLAPLFDAIPDISFFIKDTEHRYVIVNRPFAARIGIKDHYGFIGENQKLVFKSARRELCRARSINYCFRSLISDCLELHFYPGRQPGRCITSKISVCGMVGKALGLAVCPATFMR